MRLETRRKLQRTSADQRALKNSLGSFSLAFICLFVSILPLWAKKIQIDYDKSADFSKFKTYAWVQGTPVPDPRLDAYIKSSVTAALRDNGMTEVKVNAADLIVTYHAATLSDLSVGTALDPTYASSGGVEIPGQGAWSAPTAGSGSTLVRKGSLTFEFLDRAANKPVWTGTAEGTLGDSSPKWTQIQKALGELFKDFPPTSHK